MLILILLNLIVVFNSTLLSMYFIKVKELSGLLLTTFILFFAQIVLIELILGTFGLFYLSSIIFVNLLILITILSLYRKSHPVFISKPNIDPFIKSKTILFIFSVFVAFFLLKSFINLINPPWCPDSLQYHLSFPASWIRSGSLNNPFVIFSGIFNSDYPRIETSGLSYSPINAELFFAWFMLPLRNAFLADIGQLPFYIVGMIAIYAILRKYGINKKVSILSCFVWVLIPNIFKQIKSGSQTDVICSVLLLLVIFVFLLLREKLNFNNAVLFGITVGLFIGTKILNIIWLVGLLPLILYELSIAIKEQDISLKISFALFATIIMTALLLGGYVYIKNYIYTTNPLFPNNIAIFGKTIFKGLINTRVCNELYYSDNRFDLYKIIFREGLGLQFLLIILPGIILPVFLLPFLRNKIDNFSKYLFFSLTPWIMFVLYKILVNAYVTRYIFPFVTVSLLCSIIFISRFTKGGRYLELAAFISILFSIFELAHRYELIFSILLSIILFIVILVFQKRIVEFYRSRFFIKMIIACSVFFIVILGYLNIRYDRNEFDRYPLTFSKKEQWQVDIARGWKKLNEVTGRGAKVAYTGRQELYPLFGTRLKNDVKYVSVNRREALPYKNVDRNCREVKDFAVWRNNLKKEDIEYLFVALPFPENRESEDPSEFPVEDYWARIHPRDFVLLYSNSLCRIYKVTFPFR